MSDCYGRSSVRLASGMLVLAAVAACAPGRGTTAGVPVAEPEIAAQELQSSTAPDSPLQVTFTWTLDEAGSRLRGRGVARVQAPDRIRLDLFGPRGETYLSAAMVDEELRLPAGATTGQITLPSPALLWAAVGVVRPPSDARLQSATTAGNELTLRYAVGAGEIVEYVASSDAARLLRVSRSAPGAQRETLNLSFRAAGTLGSTRYRNLTAYRELILEIETVDPVASFPSTIWRPDVASR